MRKKTILALFAATAMTAVLAGCGNKNGETEVLTQTETQMTETATENDAADRVETSGEEGDALDLDEPPMVDIETTDTEELETEAVTEESHVVADPVLESPTVYPTTLPEDYAAITYTKPSDVDVAEQAETQIQEALSLSREETQVMDRETKEGDTVSVDFTGTIEGETSDALVSEDEVLTIGEGSFLEDFEKQLIGHMPGEEFQVTVTFPDDYWQESAAGKEASFDVTVNYILDYGEAPELTDDWVAENTAYETVDEYRKALEESIREEQDFNNQFNTESEIIESLVALSSVEVPDDVVEDGLDEYLDDLEKNAESNGYDNVDDYLSEVYGMDMDEYEENARNSIVGNATRASVVESLIEKEGLEVTEDGFLAYLKEEIAPNYGYDDFDEFKSDMDSYGILDYFDDLYREHVVSEFLMDKASATEGTSNGVYTIEPEDVGNGEVILGETEEIAVEDISEAPEETEESTSKSVE